MLDYRSLLEGARPLSGRGTNPFDIAFDLLVAELRSSRRRRHPPVQYIRPSDPLHPLRDAALRIDAELPGNLGVPIVRGLMLDAFPCIFELRDGPRENDGRRVAKVAMAAAWIHEEVTIAAVLELFVALANDRVTATAFTRADAWTRIIRPGAAGAQDRYDLASRLGRVGLDLARPWAVSINASARRPSKGLWIGRPPDRLYSPPPDWLAQVTAAARTLGFDIRVVDYPAVQLDGLKRSASSKEVEMLAAWAPRMTQDVAEIVAAYESAKPGQRALVISNLNFDSALETFWLGVDEFIEGWTPPPASARYEIPENRLVFLQKSNTVGDHDVFTVRAAPCSHGQFFAVHHADKGLKGVERMYGVRPKAVSKCSAAGCSCWRATFD